MTVEGFRPDADFRYSREVWDEPRHFVALRERARALCEQARETVAHSKELAWMLGDWREESLTSRCAWCRRYHVGDNWLDPARTPPIPSSRTTHSICDDCIEALRTSGRSA